MILRKFAAALLTIAAGLLACLVARADSVLVTTYGVPGFDNKLAAMYPDRLAAAALASDNLFNISGNPLIGAGLGTFTLDPESLIEAAFALPFNLSGAWVTSFSNLALPAGAYLRLPPDPSPALDFQDWAAALPPEFGLAQEDRMVSFNDLSSPPADYWDLLREPLASPDIRNWVAEIPPSFEMARDWAIAALTEDR
jgi:hypothetical protein